MPSRVLFRDGRVVMLMQSLPLFGSRVCVSRYRIHCRPHPIGAAATLNRPPMNAVSHCPSIANHSITAALSLNGYGSVACIADTSAHVVSRCVVPDRALVDLCGVQLRTGSG